MKKILLLGGSGFVGKNILIRLEKDNLDVIAPSSKECDLMNMKSIEQFLINFKPEILINAAFYGVSMRSEYKYSYLEKNLEIVSNILNASINKNLNKIIHIGSCNEYGDSDQRINETSTMDPRSLYGTVKAMCTLLALEISREHALPLVVLRPFNLYGPYDDKSVVHYLIKSLLENERVSLTKGGQIRDYLYSKDFAEIIYYLVKNPDELKNLEIYNVGSGKGITLSSMFEMIFREFNRDKNINYIPYNKYEYYSQVANTEKLNQIFKLKKLTPLNLGIKETVEWVRLNN